MSSSRREMEDLFNDPYPLRNMEGFGPFNCDRDRFNAWMGSQGLFAAGPGPETAFNFDSGGGRHGLPSASASASSRRGYNVQPAGSQRDASAYAGVPALNPRSVRSPPGVVTGAYGNVSGYAMPPPPSPWMDTPRPGPGPGPGPGPVRSPPPAYSTVNCETGKPKGRVPLPQRGSKVEEDGKKGGPRISRVQFESGRVAASQGETLKAEVKARDMAVSREQDGKREQEVMQERREKHRRDMEMEMAAKMEKRVRKLREEKYAAEVLGKILRASERKKEEEVKKVEDVGKALEGLNVEGDKEEEAGQQEEDWEVLERPDVGGVMVDECVDSDDSDTWC